MSNKKAYTTILSTDSYLHGVLSLFESIRRTNTKISDFVVIINQEIKKGTTGESYNLMAKLSVLRYNTLIPTR